MKKYMVTFETVLYVDAESEAEAREEAIEELGNVDLVGNQDLVDITEIKNAY